METIELWPFSQGELEDEPDGFVDAIFTLGPELRHESAVTRADYAARIVRGGLPEATSRDDPRRRQRDALAATTFQLPVHPGMSEAALGWVADRIRVFAEGQLP